MFFSFETMKKNSFINALGLETNKHYFGLELTNILCKVKLKQEKKSFFKPTKKGKKMQNMDSQLHSYVSQMRKESSYYYQF